MRRAVLLWLVLAVGCDEPTPDTDASMEATDAATPGADAATPTPDAGVPLRVARVEDIGALPHPSDTVAGRDGASSGVLDGQLLWTFGDTFLYEPTPVDGSNVASATGGWASVDAPLSLEQPVDGDGIPAQLIPYTDEELALNRADPLNGWSLWPGAVIDTGDDALLVLFQRIDRVEGGGFDGVAIGTARIAPRETVATRDPDDLFDAPRLYGAGGVAVQGDTAYFFACETVGPLSQGCRVARVPRAQADERAAFEFYDGIGWTEDAATAAVVIEGVGAAISVSYNAHLRRYLAVTSPPLSDDVLLRTADRIEGPWPRGGVRLDADDWDALMPAGEGTNYLAQEQVALSSADGREVVISYSRPLGSFRGEVRLARIVLE